MNDKIRTIPNYGECFTTVAEVYYWFDMELSKKHMITNISTLGQIYPFDLECYVQEYVATKFLTEHRSERINGNYTLILSKTIVNGVYRITIHRFEDMLNGELDRFPNYI